jgi:hypothetical protein
LCEWFAAFCPSGHLLGIRDSLAIDQYLAASWQMLGQYVFGLDSLTEIWVDFAYFYTGSLTNLLAVEASRPIKLSDG